MSQSAAARTKQGARRGYRSTAPSTDSARSTATSPGT